MSIAFWIFLAIWILILFGLAFWIFKATIKTIPIIILVLFLLVTGIVAYGNFNFPTATATPQVEQTVPPVEVVETEAPVEVVETEPATIEVPEVLEGQPAEYYFVPTSTLPECFPVNGPWLEAFGNGQSYEVDPADPIIDQSAFNYFEGVTIPSSPGDQHSTFEMTGKFVAEQGNIWTCGVVTDPKIKHTVLFQSADKKWQNLDDQGLAHPMLVTTAFGSWPYASGEQPAWALEAEDTNMVCPYTTVSMSNPAGVIQSDGSFVGAPGKAGCDFVAIYPDGRAVRYHDAIDNFPYPAGTRFFLFEKSMTNEEVAQAINVAYITNSWE